jgi:hypothetical protein
VPNLLRLLPLFLLLAFVAAAGNMPAASFASLVITANGDEEFDFSTGITTLPDGGSISDRQSGIVIEAEFIRYQVDVFIEASGATVQGSFGTIHAETLEIDLPESRLTASGALQLQGLALNVSGQELSYFADSGVVDVRGGVEASEPEFSAERVLHDTRSGSLLLLGPYRYDDGFLTLNASSATAQLELLPEPDGAGGVSYAASSTPSAATLELFGPWLP